MNRHLDQKIQIQIFSEKIMVLKPPPSYGIEWRRKMKRQKWCFGLRFQKSKIVELKVVICVIHCKLC